MTNERAIEILTNAIQTEHMTVEQDRALAMAQKALEYRTPEKPDIDTVNRGIDVSGEYDIDYNYVCPTCGAVIGNYETEDIWDDFCCNCGQAIDKTL